MENKKLPVVLLTGLLIYLLSAAFSFTVFSFFHAPIPGSSGLSTTAATANKTTTSRLKRDPSAPRTEECPLNGAMYTKDERTAWEKRRPLGIMIENSKAARPQSGLSSADVIYEAVAEGGITRFLTVFYCQDADVVGPTRSARTYYLDWISEYGSHPLYAHVGGANTPGPANALGQVAQYGWEFYNDLNQFSIGFPVYWLDIDRLGKNTATEHSVYTSTAKLWGYAAGKRNLTNLETNDSGQQVSWDANFTKWPFKDDASLASRPASFSAQFPLSSTQASYIDDYTVKWQYDHDSNSYLRLNGGSPHMDLDNNQQLLAKDVVLLFTTMFVADDGYDEPGHGSHTLYGTIGTGRAKFLIDGKVTDGIWKKKDRVSRTQFTDNLGKPVAFNRGQIWIEVLPIGTQVTIQ